MISLNPNSPATSHLLSITERINSRGQYVPYDPLWLRGIVRILESQPF